MDKIKCKVKNIGKQKLDEQTFNIFQDMILEVRIEWFGQQDGHIPSSEERKKECEEKLGKIIYKVINDINTTTVKIVKSNSFTSL